MPCGANAEDIAAGAEEGKSSMRAHVVVSILPPGEILLPILLIV